MKKSCAERQQKEEKKGDKSMGSMNALKNIDTEAYGFQMRDVAVAAMIKSYIMKQEDALETLGRIVSPGVRTLTLAGIERKVDTVANRPRRRRKRRTVESVVENTNSQTFHRISAYNIPQEVWATIDGEELAALIDSAKDEAKAESVQWEAQDGERLLKKSVDYVRDDFLPNLDGKQYVETIPVEMAEMITDCYITLRRLADDHNGSR